MSRMERKLLALLGSKRYIVPAGGTCALQHVNEACHRRGSWTSFRTCNDSKKILPSIEKMASLATTAVISIWWWKFFIKCWYRTNNSDKNLRTVFSLPLSSRKRLPVTETREKNKLTDYVTQWTNTRAKLLEFHIWMKIAIKEQHTKEGAVNIYPWSFAFRKFGFIWFTESTVQNTRWKGSSAFVWLMLVNELTPCCRELRNLLHILTFLTEVKWVKSLQI